MKEESKTLEEKCLNRFHDQLKKILNQFDHQAHFAWKANMSHSSLYNLLERKADITLERLVNIANAANLRMNWLLLGKGEKFLPKNQKLFSENYHQRLKIILSQYDHGISEFAKKIGLSTACLYYSLNKGKQPKLTTLVKISHIANVSIDWLAGGFQNNQEDLSNIDQNHALKLISSSLLKFKQEGKYSKNFQFFIDPKILQLSQEILEEFLIQNNLQMNIQKKFLIISIIYHYISLGESIENAKNMIKILA